MDSVLNCIKTRRSVRKYKEQAVPKELLKQIVEAGLYAASGKGKQAPVIITITNRDLITEITQVNAEIMGSPNTDTFYGAPVIILVAGSLKENDKTAFADGTLALGNMMIAAHALGLGSCWINRAKEGLSYDVYKDIFHSLGLNAEDFVGVGHLAVGYPEGDLPAAAPRLPMREFYID